MIEAPDIDGMYAEKIEGLKRFARFLAAIAIFFLLGGVAGWSVRVLTVADRAQVAAATLQTAQAKLAMERANNERSQAEAADAAITAAGYQMERDLVAIHNNDSCSAHHAGAGKGKE